eukprot:6113357-Alexandrium_andersonii.AAC.1
MSGDTTGRQIASASYSKPGALLRDSNIARRMPKKLARSICPSVRSSVRGGTGGTLWMRFSRMPSARTTRPAPAAVSSS